jgi:hypothetical protein
MMQSRGVSVSEESEAARTVRELEGAEQKLRDVSCPNEGTNIDAAKAVESVMAARCGEVEE